MNPEYCENCISGSEFTAMLHLKLPTPGVTFHTKNTISSQSSSLSAHHTSHIAHCTNYTSRITHCTNHKSHIIHHASHIAQITHCTVHVPHLALAEYHHQSSSHTAHQAEPLTLSVDWAGSLLSWGLGWLALACFLTFPSLVSL